MRVLVTGGSGYIGSHTVLALREAGHQPFVFDLREPPDGLVHAGVEWLLGDVRDGAALDAALAHGPFDAAIHLAAEKSVGASLSDPERFMDVNVGGTERVAEAVGRAGIRWVVLSSSCAVYGTPDRLPVDETAALRPENPYGTSKVRAEEALSAAAARDGFGVLSLRYFNAAGADPAGRVGEDWRDAPNLLPVAIEAALGRRGSVDVYGDDHPTPDGTPIRDYIHVVDLAEAHVAALGALERGVDVPAVNLGTGHGISVRTVLGEVGRAAGRPVPHRIVGRRPGEASAIWADPTRASQVLGWRARYGFPEIVATALAWHRRGLLDEPVSVADRGVG